MTKITNAQWQTIEANLTRVYAHQKFRLGVHEITVLKERVAENKFALIVYIDGQWKGLWMTPDKDPVYGPIVTQVWRKRTRKLYPPTQRQKLVKSVGVRRAKKLFPNLDKTIEHWVPDFNTAKSLVRQFRKVDGLELAEEVQTRAS